MKGSYFSLYEWLVIVLLSLCGALMNFYLPVKSITQRLDIPGPAAGMALLGGLIFVVWVSLGRGLIGKRYAGITIAVLLASFCLFLRPWYGVISPSWFSIYGILALFVLGLWVELLQGRWEVVGGGLGNLFCLGITWLALGLHLHVWAPAKFVPLLLLASFLSGAVGVLLARVVGGLVGGSAIMKRSYRG
ncbi:MAG: hypothetical protein DRG50_07475 [Deltaproteobacteria bacterium]|nr:MAG: hypothetical protein DRG50_07475 [Deltaproteobacteria bacterium]